MAPHTISLSPCASSALSVGRTNLADEWVDVSAAAVGLHGGCNCHSELKGGAGELRERQGPDMSGLGTSADSWLPDAHPICAHASSRLRKQC